MTKHVTIVGGGPAGLAAAQAAVRARAQVRLILDQPLGGRAMGESMFRSQAWLEAAQTFQQGQHAPETVIHDTFAQYQQLADEWRQHTHASLLEQGVEIVLGAASFSSTGALTVQSSTETQVVETDAIILATGAVPIFPPGLEPDGRRVLAPHQSTHLGAPPAHVLVVGGGAPAAEYVDALTILGFKVTWLVDHQGVMPFFSRTAVAFFLEHLNKRAVFTLIESERIATIEPQARGVRLQTVQDTTYEGDYVLLCLGHKPDLDRLNLDALHLETDTSGHIKIDGYGRTSQPHLYLVGDAAQPLSANIAMACGRIAGCHAAGLESNPFSFHSAVLAIYSNPAIAQVGLTNSEKAASVKIGLNDVLRGRLLKAEGYLEVFYDTERRIVGASAVGCHAAEIMNVVALAIHLRATTDQLKNLALAHPTLGESLSQAIAQLETTL